MEKRHEILTGNQLKLIAAATMLLDHAGILLFPQIKLLRLFGRLAYPIYAYMIAEGCRYTKNKLRYFLMLFGLGAGCQIVYYFFCGDTYLNILLTFSVSVLLIYALQAAHGRRKQGLWSAVFAAGVLGAVGLDMLVTIDYGFWGIMTPVMVSFAHARKFPRWAEVFLLGAGLVFLGADFGGYQHYAPLSLPFLLCYSGKRGTADMKYFFYIFYPVHLAVLQGIAMLLG